MLYIKYLKNHPISYIYTFDNTIYYQKSFLIKQSKKAQKIKLSKEEANRIIEEDNFIKVPFVESLVVIGKGKKSKYMGYLGSINAQINHKKEVLKVIGDLLPIVDIVSNPPIKEMKANIYKCLHIFPYYFDLAPFEKGFVAVYIFLQRQLNIFKEDSASFEEREAFAINLINTHKALEAERSKNMEEFSGEITGKQTLNFTKIKFSQLPSSIFEDTDLNKELSLNYNFYKWNAFDEKKEGERFLFHGTCIENIISQKVLKGLSEKKARDGMFGRGCYFAHNFKKSEQYIKGEVNSIYGRFMLVYAVDLSDTFHIYNTHQHDVFLKQLYKVERGYKHVVPTVHAHKDNGKSKTHFLYNDEYVCYQDDKFRLAYLIEFR